MLLSDSDGALSWFCLDAGAIPDVDYTGGQTLKQLHEVVKEHSARLIVLEAIGPVSRELARYGIVDLVGNDAIYPTVDAGYQAYLDNAGSR